MGEVLEEQLRHAGLGRSFHGCGLEIALGWARVEAGAAGARAVPRQGHTGGPGGWEEEPGAPRIWPERQGGVGLPSAEMGSWGTPGRGRLCTGKACRQTGVLGTQPQSRRRPGLVAAEALECPRREALRAPGLAGPQAARL